VAAVSTCGYLGVVLRTKSVHSPIDRKNDGLRILATRLRGRGLSSTRYDVWMANLGPSESLLRRFQRRVDDPGAWRSFSQRYREEIFPPARFDPSNPNIKNYGQKFTRRLLRELSRRQNVTIMCHCDESETRCHRHLLRKLIESA